MNQPQPYVKPPTHLLAWAGFAVAVLSVLLAWYGSLHAEKHIPDSLLLQARGRPKTPPEPGLWYEKLFVRSENTVLGGPLDQKILALTSRSPVARWSVVTIAYGLPLALGLLATYVGASAVRRIELARGKSTGFFQAVVAIMIGGFSSVISACMIFSQFVWPLMPSVYTR
jgi:hypothetical protein